MSALGPHRWSVPWRSLVVAAAALVAAAIHRGVSLLAYERDAILNGELWRLWTGHLMHASPYHLLWNVLPLIALGLLWEPLLKRGFWCLLGVSSTLVSAGLVVFDPALVGYVGLSGALNGIWIGGTLLAARGEGALGNRRGQLLFTAFVMLDLAKIAFEAWTGTPVFTETQSLGIRSVPLAHALGALGGMLWFLALRRAEHGQGPEPIKTEITRAWLVGRTSDLPDIAIPAGKRITIRSHFNPLDRNGAPPLDLLAQRWRGAQKDLRGAWRLR